MVAYEDYNRSRKNVINFRYIIISAVLFLIIVITVVANGLVVVAILCFRRLRSQTNMALFSLALADLLVGCVVMPLAAIYEIRGWWIFSDEVFENKVYEIPIV